GPSRGDPRIGLGGGGGEHLHPDAADPAGGRAARCTPTQRYRQRRGV
ncbi:MAG: hypothetical protein AVDCRST_MAG18-2446, partial [uncultured Thermomicrobiales bacterium]